MTNKNIIGHKNLNNQIEPNNFSIINNDRAMRKLLKKAHEEYLTEDRLDIPRKEKIIKPIYYYIAASIIFLAISIGFIFNFVIPSKQIDSEKIYNKFYKAFPAESIVLTDDIKNESLKYAINAYKNQKFALAGEFFNKAIDHQPDIANASFFMGISFMETGQHKQAIASFHSVLHLKDKTFHSQAHWYLALTWIKLNNPSEAQNHLVWLKKNDPALSEIAQNLLDTIKQ